MSSQNQRPAGSCIANENVVVRLKQRLRDARAIGFHVRMETLDGEQASWCEIGGVPTLFVDLSQTAAEQLQQVEETLAAHAAEQSGSDSQTTRQIDVDLTKRAA